MTPTHPAFERVTWPDPAEPTLRLRIWRPENDGVCEVAAEWMPFPGAVRAKPTESRRIFLTSAEAQWLRDALTEMLGDQETT